MNLRFYVLAFSFLLASSGVAFAQSVLRGTLIDGETNEPLIGASIYIDEYKTGTVTDFEGHFTLRVRQVGEMTLVLSMIGYESQERFLNLAAARELDLGVVKMLSSTIGLNEANVIASVAVDRATPVAVSTLDARTIEEVIGDKELVETLNITPGVYATKSGGGFGDSRINIRGFDQRNVAVLIGNLITLCPHLIGSNF